jgi:glycerol-3-phosphate acyltransferase PlsY
MPCDCSNLSANPVIYLYLAGFFAIIGHIFPVWLKFKGGKGVATTLGTLLILQPIVGAAACATWLVTALISRISSLSALAAAGLAPGFLAFGGYSSMVLLAVVLAVLVWVRHAANIRRLKDGTEPKIGKKTA